MELNDIKPNVEILGDFEEQFFSIEDTGMIFDILRNKMYSNPILAICREISCNARDAHREVGKADVPVHIYLPNSLEKYYKVQDFGPGISPDRMANIFIKYTASTKRRDNLQTGGFGLGAKTPFSYSDSFSIVTNYNGVQYNYNCFIDPTKVGKLGLFSQTPTSEPNGTTIIIPVQDRHFNEFNIYTEQACRHWDVKPVIHGQEIRWQEPKKVLEGTGWAIASSNDWQKASKLIIDGIEYPLSLDDLRRHADAKLIDSARGNFLMYFGVGELSLSANRESVYLDERTQAAIRNRLADCLKEIRDKVNDKIQAIPNLWEANAYFRKDLKTGFHSLDFLGKLDWHGVELNESYMHVDCTVFCFTRGGRTRRGMPKDPNKLTRHMTKHLSFEDKSQLYVNDLALREPNPRHVKKAFDDDPGLESLQLIVPNDKTTEAVLNKEIHLDKMLPKYLSSITKATTRKYTASATRLLIFKFDVGSCAFRKVSYASLDDDPNLKVLVFLRKDDYNPNNREAYTKSKTHLGTNSIKAMAEKWTNYSFYGVGEDTPEERLDEDFDTFTMVDDFIDDVALSNKVDYVSIKFAKDNLRHLDNTLLKHEAYFRKNVQDPNSVLLKSLDLQCKIKTLASNADGNLLYLYELINGEIDSKQLNDYLSQNKDLDVQKVNDKFSKTYPLWRNLARDYYFQETLAGVVEYINLIDNK